MKHPPYHLRLNKAIDRYLLIDILSRLARKNDLAEYNYYGLGGPFLEDFRLMGRYFHDLRMTSLESNEQTFRRQRFHQCTKKLVLLKERVDSFLATFSVDTPSIFWLDYTDLQPARIQELETLLDRVGEDSVVKITLRASLDDLPDAKTSVLPEPTDEEMQERMRLYLDNFKAKFDAVLPALIEYGQLRAGNFPALLQKMLQIAAQRALPPGCGRKFQILHSCYYSDVTQMYSLTGIVCRDEDARAYRSLFATWPLKNLRWAEPKRIDLPVLSVKERMLLESYLPADRATGKGLRNALGYDIDDGGPASIRKLKQYAVFYRYYPYFAKVNVT
jgi:hypothetical protein